VTASYIEIYQEKLNDLLRPPSDPDNNAKAIDKLVINESPLNGMWIPNAVRTLV
jgi:hypothetical protein